MGTSEKEIEKKRLLLRTGENAGFKMPLVHMVVVFPTCKQKPKERSREK